MANNAIEVLQKIRIVKSIYNTVHDRVILDGNKSKIFEMIRRIKQGDLLSHLLPVQVDGTLYAEDIIIFAHTKRKMKALIDKKKKK